MNDLRKSLLVDYKVTNAREERAEEAAVILSYFSNHDLENGRILDIGCGNGATTKWFSQHANTYSIGIEIHNNQFKILQRKNQKLNYLQASGLKTPFKDKTFHTVILNDVLEHVSYLEATALFQEINRILDTNGQLYVSVANKYQIREPHSNLLLISWLPRWIYSSVVRSLFHDDVYPYTVRRFQDLAKNTNFSTKDLSWYYVAKKIRNLNYIGNTIIRPVLQILKDMKIIGSFGFRKFLQTFSVLIFVLKKVSTNENRYSQPLPHSTTRDGIEFIFNPPIAPEERVQTVSTWSL